MILVHAFLLNMPPKKTNGKEEERDYDLENITMSMQINSMRHEISLCAFSITLYF